MGKFSYENQGANVFLVYELDKTETIDNLSLGMITNNVIPGMIPMIYMQLDTKRFFKYNITSKVTVKQLFEGMVTKKRFLGMCRGVADAFISSYEYMLDDNSILLDSNYIFADVSTCEAEVVCLPVVNDKEENKNALPEFIKKTLLENRYDQSEDVGYVTSIMNYLNSSVMFSLEGFRNILDEIEKNTISEKPTPIATVVTTEKHVKTSVNTNVQQQVNVPNQNISQQSQEPTVQKPVIQRAVEVKTVESKVVTPRPVPVQQEIPPLVLPGGKKISKIYLLRHYDKETKALYDEQQKAIKEHEAKVAAIKKANAAAVAGNTTVSAPPVKQSTVTKATPAKQKKATAATNVGFAIPGQNTVMQNTTINTPKPATSISGPGVTNVDATQFQQQALGSAADQRTVVKSANFGETTVLSNVEVGGTQVLSNVSLNSNKEKTATLIRKKNNENISVNKDIFKIGKERSYVEYFIADNPAISRSHACIIKRGDQYFLSDTNSTNHTYLNGNMLASGAESELHNGDEIKLADEEFYFRIN